MQGTLLTGALKMRSLNVCCDTDSVDRKHGFGCRCRNHCMAAVSLCDVTGCTGSHLAAATAAAAGGGGGGRGAGSTDSSATALAHLEAVLDHARSKGRHVLLVNNCPDMQWEPTTRE